MSIAVDPAELAATLATYAEGYLLTVGDGRVKAVSVTARADGDVVRVAGGSGGSARNLAEQPAATLLFPPVEPHGYTLLVDGTAVPGGEGFVLTPASAVLHRPAAHAEGCHRHRRRQRQRLR